MPPSDNQRVLQGLKSLKKYDTVIIKAAAAFEKLEGNPPGTTQLAVHSFPVVGKPNPAIPYRGIMTDEQATYLNNYLASVRKFADAISRILIKIETHVIKKILPTLDCALNLPTPTKLQVTVGGVAPPPPTICCTYDTDQHIDGVTASFCQTGLLGVPSPSPCMRDPEKKR